MIFGIKKGSIKESICGLRFIGFFIDKEIESKGFSRFKEYNFGGLNN